MAYPGIRSIGGGKGLLTAPLLVLAISMPARGEHDQLTGFVASPDAGEMEMALRVRAVERTRFESDRGLRPADRARDLRREFGQQRAERARKRTVSSGRP